MARWQLLELGLTPGVISKRRANGRLHSLNAGVYAVGHPAVSGRGRLIADVLACGPGAVLSHQAAGALWGLRPSARTVTDVTVPGRSRRGRPGIKIHRARELHPDDIDVIDGIRVTSVARTLIDLAGVLTRDQLDRAIEATERLRLFDLTAIIQALARANGRRGAKALRAALKDAVQAPPTRSELERDFLGLCDRHGIPRPNVNTVIEGYEVDAAWPAERFLVELDSRGFHDTAAAFERDRERDATLMLAGYRVLRVTWRRMAKEPRAVAETVERLRRK